MCVLIVILLLCLVGLWTSFSSSLLLTSRYELKKRAQSGDKQTKIIFALSTQGREVIVAMLLGGLLAVGLMAVLLDSYMYSLLAAGLAALLTGVFGVLLPLAYGEKLGLKVTARLAPLANKILFLLRPISRPLGRVLDDALGKKSLLYSKEQLLRIIDDHTKSAYADISAAEADLIRHSLLFGTIKISDVMVPRSVVSMVSAGDQMGPVLMDELHKSGHSRFPVSDSADINLIVGTLYLHDLIGEKRSGAVKKLMSPHVYFVHEELDLNHALDAFIKTKHHLFIVVNNFEEYVGIITIEDVIEQVLGRQIVDEFDNYENLREVAQLRAVKEHAKNSQKMVK